MRNNDKRDYKKAVIFIIGIALIIAVLSIFAVFSASIMYWLGFEYESVGSFILYFIIGSFVSYPMNLIAGALPKALLKLKKISKSPAIFLYMVLDTIATFLGFYLVDVSMSSVSSSNISLLVLALIFAALAISDITEKTND